MKKSNRFKLVLYYVLLIIVIFSILFFSYDVNMRNNVSNELSHFYQEVESVSATNVKNHDMNLDMISFSPDVDLEYYRQYYSNEEIIARLEIPDLFNLMIARTSNNEYYLNHSIDRSSNVKGTEFMDFRTDVDSQQINIYGHNSPIYDLPFGKLENYLNESFYQNHQYIILQYDYGKRIYQIFSFKKITSDYEHMNVNVASDAFVTHLNHLKNNSIYSTDVTFDKNSNVIILQTCTNDNDNSYYILSAVEI